MQAINCSSTVYCSHGLPPISITPRKIRTAIMTKPQKIKLIPNQANWGEIDRPFIPLSNKSCPVICAPNELLSSHGIREL